MSFEGAFNGAGDTWTPTRLNFYCMWLGQVPAAWILAETFRLGPLGVYVAVLLSFSALALWSGVLFRRGRWKEQKI
jgi:Na+-driven multidrug efflux pump